MMTNTSLRLPGCTHDPLLSYLKALGVLRLISNQRDTNVRGSWSKDYVFQLESKLNQDELLGFLLEDYLPTPFVAPWNGGSGFYGKTAQDFLEKIELSSNLRFAVYRDAIKESKAILEELGLEKTPDVKVKENLLSLCRSRLPNEVVEVLDSLYIITSDTSGTSQKSVPRFAPVLGSGGNDGNLEFTYTFFKYLQAVIPTDKNQWTEKNKENSRQWLEKSLFDSGNPPLLKGAVGQYNPGGVGGPNSTRGFEGDSLVNPWDYVLAFEGIVLFAGAVSRRYSETTSTAASFPFSVGVSAAGWGTLSETEADSQARSELWLPLWHNPATSREISYLFSEGRAKVGRRQAATGVDFARAIAGLGVDRGIKSFHRIGFLSGSRHGKAHMASSLGTFTVVARPKVSLLDELDPWLQSYNNNFKNASASSRSVMREIEEAMYGYCQHGGSSRLQKVLIALGKASQLVGRSKSENKPIPLKISPAWLESTDDGTPEFRVAAAIASIQGSVDGKIGSIRQNIEPVKFEKGRYKWEKSKDTVSISRLPDTLYAILERRMLAATQNSNEVLPLSGKALANLDDVQLLLEGALNENKLLSLIQGLVLLDWKNSTLTQWPQQKPQYPISRCYATLKLLFLPYHFSWPPGSEPVKVRAEQILLKKLKAKDLDSAMKIATRRLRSSGLATIASPETRGHYLDPVSTTQMPGALLVPVTDVNRLARLVLNKKSKGDES